MHGAVSPLSLYSDEIGKNKAPYYRRWFGITYDVIEYIWMRMSVGVGVMGENCCVAFGKRLVANDVNV